jgi:hypothetical protein
VSFNSRLFEGSFNSLKFGRSFNSRKFGRGIQGVFTARTWGAITHE